MVLGGYGIVGGMVGCSRGTGAAGAVAVGEAAGAVVGAAAGAVVLTEVGRPNGALKAPLYMF